MIARHLHQRRNQSLEKLKLSPARGPRRVTARQCSSIPGKGKDVSGLTLVETLGSYSEKGMTYVKTLKSIITANDLEVADKTYLRDEPLLSRKEGN